MILRRPEFAFFLQLFERRNDHGQQLQNDRRRDVGHDAQRENRQPAEHAAAEQIEVAEQRALILLEELLEAVGVDAGSGDVPAQAVDGQQSQREQDAACADPESERRCMASRNFMATSLCCSLAS